MIGKNYSRNCLSSVIHAAEKHGPITLTRRGKAVAVVVSEADFSKLSQNKKDYWEALQAFRTHHDFAENALAEEDLKGLRQPETGRDFAWKKRSTYSTLTYCPSR